MAATKKAGSRNLTTKAKPGYVKPMAVEQTTKQNGLVPVSTKKSYSPIPSSLDPKKINADELAEMLSEMINGPQTINYLTKNTFSQGVSLTPVGSENEAVLKLVSDKLKNINGGGTSLEDILRFLIARGAVTGDAFLRKQLTEDGKGIANLFTVTDPVEIITELNEFGIEVLKGYNLGKNMKKVFVPKEEIIHFKFNDNGGFNGETPLSEQTQLIALTLSIIEKNKSIVTNDPTSRTHIWNKDANEQEAASFLATYQAQHMGIDSSAKPVVTYGDWEMDIKTIGGGDTYMLDFLKKYGENIIPSLFGVAISELQNANTAYNNVEGGHKTTVLSAIYPLQERLELIVNRDILPGIQKFVTRKETELIYTYEILRENVDLSLSNAAQIAVLVSNGIITRNEARRMIDPTTLPPLDEGDVVTVTIDATTGKNITDELFLGEDIYEERAAEKQFQTVCKHLQK